MAEQFFLWQNDAEKQKNRVLDNFYNYLVYLQKKEIDITLTVAKTKKDVTSKQHKYIWGVVLEHGLKGMHDLGNEITKKEFYLFLKERLGFAKKVIIKIKDKVVERLQYETLSRKGDIERAIEFIDKAIRWIAEWLNVIVPEPNERGLECTQKKN